MCGFIWCIGVRSEKSSATRVGNSYINSSFCETLNLSIISCKERERERSEVKNMVDGLHSLTSIKIFIFGLFMSLENLAANKSEAPASNFRVDLLTFP